MPFLAMNVSLLTYLVDASHDAVSQAARCEFTVSTSDIPKILLMHARLYRYIA